MGKCKAVQKDGSPRTIDIGNGNGHWIDSTLLPFICRTDCKFKWVAGGNFALSHCPTLFVDEVPASVHGKHG